MKYRDVCKLIKKSSVQSEVVSHAITDAILPGITSLPGTVVNLFNMKGDTKGYDKTPGIGALPGVSSARVALRRNQIPDVLGVDNKSKPTHETLGPIPGAILTSVLTGTPSGAHINSLIGGLAALMTKKRTAQEQKKYQTSHSFWNYLPVVSEYNKWKNLGFMMGDQYKQLRNKKLGLNDK